MPLPDRLSFLRSRWSWLAIVWTILPFLVRAFPLAGEIQYEFAAVVAIAASVFSAAIPLLSRRATLSDAGALDSGRLWELAPRTLAASLIPLGVYILLLPFSKQCGIDEGISWYLLLVLPSATIGMILGASIAALVERSWLRIVSFAGIWLLSLVRGGYEAIDGPHIYLYCWQVGFFPGGSWDADLPVPALLLVYRAWHILIALALATVVIQIVRQRSGRPVQSALLLPVVTLAIVSTLVITNRTEIGLTRSESWLREELGDSLHTRFATIYYHAGSADSLDLWRAANYTDFFVRQQADQLGIDTSHVDPIVLYLYANSSEQKRLVGTSSASFTKPWKRMIHQTFDRIGSTLEHELVHVMMEPFGNPLGVSISQGLLEGSAVALEDDREWRTIHDDAGMLYAFNMAPPPEKIMGVSGFTAQRASVAYLIAGSFSRWLIDSYGIARYRKVFAWGDFEEVYGKPISELSSEYMRFIEPEMEIFPDRWRIRTTMRHLYGGGSFFYQRCLRRLGVLNAAGLRALAEEKYDEALVRFAASMDEGITYTARGGVLRTLYGMGEYRRMLDSAAVYDRDTASYPLLPYLIERGDAWWALGDTANARRLYDSVDLLSIGRSTSGRVAQRLFFLDPGSDTVRGDSSSQAVRALMRSYFTRSMSVLQRVAVLESALRIATDPGEIVLLSFMKASLLAPTLPRTAASIVRTVLSRHGELLRHFSFDNGFPHLSSAVHYLAVSLRDPLLYDAMLRRESASAPIDQLGHEFELEDLFDSETSIPGDPPATEQKRFEIYLLNAGLLP